MRFDFAIAHVPGKLMYTADSLSRSPQECKVQESKSRNDLRDEVEAYVNAVLVTLPASDISLHSGLLLRGRRIIIPRRLRADALRRLHDGHQGITKTHANVASSVWWPGICQDITKIVQNCATWDKYRRECIKPTKGTEFPD